ncbi:uncharacterized protein LOC134291125 [Aedes albopictus]|uniref:Uncharacterized protein n=1 Tax=Aedes albopictus TaxID=7160 RepID=A0ABM1XPG1_AEDAL|nr:hypothetical protein RP20_CCG002290 [Aedes albopictus]
MWSTFRKHDNSKKRVDLETLAEVPGRLPFNLFHRPKEIIGPAKENRSNSSGKISSAGNNRSCRNRPKVNLFPQISLTDLSDKDLNQVVDYMYSSDWKEASAYCARASCTNLGEMHQTITMIDGTDIKDTLSDRFRRRSDKVPYFDLPSSDVDLQKWYKSVV